MSRSWQTIDDFEHARTGTSALGTPLASTRVSHSGRRHRLGSRRSAAAPKLLVIDLIAEHDVEAHEEFSREGDSGLGPSAAVQYGEVATTKIIVGAGGERSRLSKHPPEQGIPLLGDLPQPLFVSRNSSPFPV